MARSWEPPDAPPDAVAAAKSEADQRQFRAEREARIQLLSEQVDFQLRRRGKSHRGSRRQVVCISDVDPATGGHPVFRSVTDAGASVGRACDNVAQSISRRGTCNGKRFAYLDAMGPGELVTAAGRLFFVPSKSIRQRCRGEPTPPAGAVAAIR
jgi:hypothetical protein